MLRFLVNAISASVAFVPLISRADTATWLANPANGNWNDPVNWTTGGPPNGPTDTAIFDTSNQTAISLSASTEVNSISLNNGASSYKISVRPGLTLTISGAGMVGASYLATFTTEVTNAGTPDRGQVWFAGSASAGNSFFISNGCANGGVSGRTVFFNNSTAGRAQLTQHSPTQNGGDGGRALFFDNASAGSASIGNYGGVPVTVQGGERGRGVTSFYNNSTAGDANIYNIAGVSNGEAGGVTQFLDSSSASGSHLQCFGGTMSGAPGAEIDFFGNSTAASASLLAREGSNGGDGGAIYFRENSTGGTPSIELRGNGFLDISDHDAPGVIIASFQGEGNVFLGSRNLSVGGRSVGFEGVIQDGGDGGGTGGSLTKVGTETLFLYNANTYSGGTVISGGALYAVHDHALGTGNVTLVTPGTTLACQPFEIGATNDYVADTATLSIVTTALINLIYHGTDTIGVLIIDGVVQPPGLYGATDAKQRSRSGASSVGFLGTGKLLAQQPVAVSRKVHGDTSFDVYLPLTGSPGIECRSGGVSSNYQLVVRFLSNATFTTATVTSGNGMVTSVNGNGTTQATIDLAGVTNQQTISITLFGLNDGLSLRDLVIPMGILVGDTTGNGIVNSSDVSQSKGQSGQPLTPANFREDITASGDINSSDVSAVKSHSGTALPTAAPAQREVLPRLGHKTPQLP